ncbi:hypothetical protein [Natronococcus occultus]|uniref:hypothetical protein n=1 Tax=Natronococcus occultus TaxID=29288 RepID=UPI0012F89569|nr:hypothetical protein [Natronococcus occultus]
MKCANCGWGYGDYRQPFYCPGCGEEWNEKTVEDVDWPIRVHYAPRPDIRRLVSETTGVEEGRLREDFSDEYELFIELLVHRDGSVELTGDQE